MHANWLHLSSNLPGLLVLGWLASLVSLRHFVQASAFIIVGSGVLVWLLARPGMHLGASGWLFGLWALLLAQAWFQRSLGSLLIALRVLFYYGGWWFGLLPSQGISFEYHLFGALCGVLYAAFSRRAKGAYFLTFGSGRVPVVGCIGVSPPCRESTRGALARRLSLGARLLAP